MNKTVFKVYFNDEIHRISIPDVTFSELISTITNLFPSFNRASHQLKYLDEEGELISVCSDIELEDALEQYQNKPLRLYVVAKDKPLNPEQLSSYLTACSSGELAETSISQVVPPSQELADTNDLNALEEVQKEVAGEVENLNQSFQKVRDEELKKNFLKPLIDELFKALFVVTKTLKEMFEKKWISMKEYMEARVAFFREEMRKFKLKVREMFQKLGDKIKGPQPEVAMTDVDEVERQVLRLSVTEPIPLPNVESTEEVKTPVEEVLARVEQPVEATPEPTPTPTEELPSANDQVEKLVQQLVDMGFTNRQQNRTLIEKHRGDLLLVINDLV